MVIFDAVDITGVTRDFLLGYRKMDKTIEYGVAGDAAVACNFVSSL